MTGRAEKASDRVNDFAAQQFAESLLDGETRRRLDEIQTLIAIHQAITSRLELDQVLQHIADSARRLTSAAKAGVFLINENQAQLVVVSGEGDENAFLGRSVPIEGSLIEVAIETGSPLTIKDATIDPHLMDNPQRRFLVEATGARSLIVVPLKVENQVVGTISIADERVGAFTSIEESILALLASSASIGLTNAQIFKSESEQRLQAERRRQVAEGLAEILADINARKPLDRILDRIVEEAKKILETEVVALYLVDAEDQLIRIQASRGIGDDDVRKIQFPIGEGTVGQAIQEARPIILNDRSPKVADTILQETAVLMVVPLLGKDIVYGALALYTGKPRSFTQEEAELASTLAGHAALAIENAKLRQQVEQTAIASERSRLARELHDAVTQTLFSASLIGDVLPLLWKEDPEEGQRHLDQLRRLTRGALAEMRTLLHELRPQSLEKADIHELFRHLTLAFTAHSQLPVQLTVVPVEEIPVQVKIALYRILQEALNNILKHASAANVRVLLRPQNGRVILEVQDDGCGFDPEHANPAHLGLGIMNERAESIGATLRVESEPGGGTVIRVLWPKELEVEQ